VRSGVRLYWEVYGEGRPTVLFLPSCAMVDSRVWKMQVPYLARHLRVIVFDPRGNGRSDRPGDPSAHVDAELVEDILAVLDATDTAQAVGVSLSTAASVLLRFAVGHPDRITGAVFVAPSLHWEDEVASPLVRRFEEPVVTDVGWGRYNAQYWRRDLRGFAEFYFGEVFAEPHSTKLIDDAVGWMLASDPETLIAVERAPRLACTAGGPISEPDAAELANLVRCPSLVVHGDDDRVIGVGASAFLADALGCAVAVFAGGGHCVPARHPVRFNLLLRDFAIRSGG
jgi:pimeloyl-ACP methyl ester carboxylesterase